MSNFLESAMNAPIYISDDEELYEKGGVRVCVEDENGKRYFIYGEKAIKLAKLAIRNKIGR